MSLNPCAITPIPEETVRVARAAFPQGHRSMARRDVLGVLSSDTDFTDLSRPVGQSAEPPWRVALVTLMQCSEHLTDRQAAEAVRGRLDGPTLANGRKWAVISDHCLNGRNPTRVRAASTLNAYLP